METRGRSGTIEKKKEAKEELRRVESVKVLNI
jgi:hypothetical protein